MSNFGTTDFDYRVALGKVPGYTTWNKFGYNLAIPVGTEVVASFGGTYTPLLAAETLSFVSTDVNDIAAGTGAQSIVITGMGAGYVEVVEVLALNGTTPVITTNAFLAIDRVSVYLSGTAQGNIGTVTATSTGSATIEAQMPAGSGTTQQCIFTTHNNGTALFRDIDINCHKFGAGTAPIVTVVAWVYSAVSGSKYEVYRTDIDTSVDNHLEHSQHIPFVVGPSSTFWLEATSDKAGANCHARFSFVEVQE